MLRRILTLAVFRYVRGQGRSWLYTSTVLVLWQLFTRSATRKAVVDISRPRPGDKIVIEHLDITHKQQMKDQKRARKAERRAARG
jgi:hypothetical protein